MPAHRGRVIAVDRGSAIVRCEQVDITVEDAPPTWRAGDLVDLDRPRDASIVGRSQVADYPGRGSEVMRLPRRRLDLLRERARVLQAVRAFFTERGFLEVETPLLVPSPGLEIHLEAVPASGGYLITSPEYQMKRLLAAGLEKIVQVCRCFRANERGAYHSSEFTMIEWYRAFDSLESIIADTEQLVHAVCGDHARVGDRLVDVKPPWRRLTVREAMRTWANIDVAGDEPAAELVHRVRAAGIAVDDGTAWDDAFFAAFLDKVDPQLAALDHAVILHDWPAPLAALARRKDGEPATALRFEAYVGGIELANAFDELIDPAEQRARFGDDLRSRAERGRAEYPLDEKLLAALAEGLPPSAGIALGFDRLVMLATGASTIDDVLTFTSDEL